MSVYEVMPQGYTEPAAEPTAEPVVTEPSPATEPTPAESVSVPTPEPQPVVDERDAYELLGFEKGGGDFAKIVSAVKTGKLKEYIDITSRDYSTVGDEDAARASMEEQYPMLSKEDREVLYRNKYATDADGNLTDIARIMQKADAHQWRTQKMQQQSEYTIPEYTPPTPAVNAEQQQQKEFEEQLLKTINEHPSLSAFESKRTIPLGSGDQVFNFEPTKDFNARAAILDPAGLFKVLFTDKGLDMDRMLKVYNYAFNMDDVESALINHGMTMKDKQQFNDLRNVNDNPVPAAPAAVPKYEVVR